MDKIKPPKKWIVFAGLFTLAMIILISAAGVGYQQASKQYFKFIKSISLA